MKPSFARRYITLGRVNASEREDHVGVLGSYLGDDPLPKAKDLVWGLSTRKIRISSPIQ